MKQKEKVDYLCHQLTLSLAFLFIWKFFLDRNTIIAISQENRLSTFFKFFIPIQTLHFNFKNINDKFEIDKKTLNKYQECLPRISNKLVDPLAEHLIDHFPKDFLHRLVSKYIVHEIHQMISLETLAKQHGISRQHIKFPCNLIKLQKFINQTQHSASIAHLVSTKIIILMLLFLFLTKPLFFKIKNTSHDASDNIALRAYKAGFTLNTQPRLDWMTKGEGFNQKNIFIIAEDSVSQSFKVSAQEQYQFINAHRIHYQFSGTLISFFKSIPAALTFIFQLMRLGPEVLGSTYSLQVIIAINYLRWKSILNDLNLNQFISYHDYGLDQIFRNYYLAQNNTKTIHYKHTFAENIFDMNDHGFRAHHSFIKYTLEMHWGLSSLKQSTASLSQSTMKEVIGPLWTTNVRHERADSLLVISVFPTSYGVIGAVHGDEAHFEFLNSIYLLCKKHWVKKIIFKGKYPFKHYLNSRLDKLSKIAAVLLDEKKFLELPSTETVEKAIIQSDLSLSMSFSSSFLVSLFSGVRAIYFDPFNRYKDSIYSSYQSLVCYNYTTLESSILELNSLSEAEFLAMQRRISSDEFGDYDFNISSEERFLSLLKAM